MSSGHLIDFNGGASLTSAPGNYLQYMTTGGNRLRYMAGATELWSVADGGTFAVTNNATVGGTLTGTGSVQAQSGLTVGTSSATNPNLVINGALANTPRVEWWTAGQIQWRLGVSGTNDLLLSRYVAGVAKGTAFSLNNVSGVMSVPQAFAGTYSGAATQDNYWQITSDTRNSNANITYWQHVATLGGSGADGSRVGGSFIVNQSANLAGASNYILQALGCQLKIDANGGGSAGNYKGGACGFNPGVVFTANAQFVRGTTIIEADFSAAAGARYYSTAGILIAKTSPHAAHGDANIDTALLVSDSAGVSSANGWDFGVVLGTFNAGNQPFKPSATGIAFMPGGTEGVSPLTLRRAIDGLGATLSASFLRSQGFHVDGGNASGAVVQIGTAQISGSATGLAVNVPGAVATGTALNAGGTGWAPGDVFEFGVMGLGYVVNVSAGAVATYTIKRLPYDFSGSPPATLAATASTYSLGTGLVLNVTWNTTATTLSLQPSGGATTVGGALTVAGAGTVNGNLVAGNLFTNAITANTTLTVTGGAGFHGSAPAATKPAVTGAKGSNAALASVIAALVSYGLISDSTSA
jgi:hypothetical protein